MMKGQMFLLAAIIIITGIVLVFNVVGAPHITEEKRFQDTMVPEKNIKNVMNEYIFSLGAATLSSTPDEAVKRAMSNFSAYMRSEFDSNVFYVVALYNKSDQRYSVIVGNYLDRAVNVTVNATSSTPSSNYTFLGDKQSSSLYFSSSVNGTVNITVYYKKGAEDVTEIFSLAAAGRNSTAGIFDVTLRGERSSINRKETYNRTW